MISQTEVLAGVLSTEEITRVCQGLSRLTYELAERRFKTDDLQKKAELQAEHDAVLLLLDKVRIRNSLDIKL
jgi:hypothetical protein